MKIIIGDALQQLKKMRSESVDCVITSPPYYALRDYGVPGQLGLEPTYFAYLEALLSIFREVKRVLKQTGTCWVNMGDTYGGSGKGYGDKSNDPKFGKGRGRTIAPRKYEHKKSLLQIPSRFAIEMVNAGWILRNEIIWQKPNAMPQSVKDRFTVDHEKLFFFTKQQRYLFTQQFEPLATSTLRDHRIFNKEYSDRRRERGYAGGRAQQGSGMLRPTGGNRRNKRTVWAIPTTPQKDKGLHFAVFPERLVETPILAGSPQGGGSTRSIRR